MVQNTVRLKVNWGDTDMAGIIYYPNYFKWFDMGSLTLVNAAGISVKDLMREQKIGLPVLDVGCRFRRPLLYNDEIRVVSRITEVNEKTFRIEHEVFRDDELTGHGYEIRGWVHFDENGRLKSQVIPDEVRNLLTEDRVITT
jgi:acyl-CoA thioester hydrolase